MLDPDMDKKQFHKQESIIKVVLMLNNIM